MKKLSFVLIIEILVLFACNMKEKGRFFTKEKYENEFFQDVNKDVLRRINQDSSITSDSMVFTFWFITDEKQKLDALADYLRNNLKDHKIVKLKQADEIWELEGKSNAIKLDIESINEWDEKLWNIGYIFDCKPDGWETTHPRDLWPDTAEPHLELFIRRKYVFCTTLLNIFSRRCYADKKH